MGKLITDILFNHLDYLYYLNDFFIQDDQKKTFTISYYNGDILITTQTVVQGQSGNYTGETPTKEQDAQYTYAFSGWSESNDNTVDVDVLTNITADKNVYACFTQTLRKYTVTFVRASADGGGTLQTINNVDYGTVITAASAYTGSTPTTTQGSATDYPFEGWNPASATVQGDTAFTAKFGSLIEVAEITDSWDTIIANIDNGTYATKYKVGNYKPLDLGTEGTINMQIVAMDADELADGSGTAPLTFLGMELLATKRTFSTTDWSTNTNIRGYLNDTLLLTIASNVRSRIQTVNKYTREYRNIQTLSNDKLWIPSGKEVGGVGWKEDKAKYYNMLFTDNASRIRKRYGQSNSEAWLLRSYCRSSGAYDYMAGINNSGVVSDGLSDRVYLTSVPYGVCLGFCLGLEPET